jgi:hypothetical protein
MYTILPDGSKQKENDLPPTGRSDLNVNDQNRE